MCNIKVEVWYLIGDEEDGKNPLRVGGQAAEDNVRSGASASLAPLLSF